MFDARSDKKGWIRCGKCEHKLARVIEGGSSDSPQKIEFKCHSCKSINIWLSKPIDGVVSYDK